MYLNEIDPFCCKVLRKNFPGAFVDERDIREVSPADVGAYSECHLFSGIGGFPLGFSMAGWSGPVWTAGFPCKQTSTAAAIQGRRNGLAGRDSGLWYEAVRLIRGVRPETVVVENVPGANSWSREIEGCLEEIGYGVRQLRVSAGDVGAPHLRRRVFWIAHRDRKRLEVAWQSIASQASGIQGRTADRNPWLSPLPRGVRVADGLPGRLDRRKRIEAVGNSVVPAVAKTVAEALKNLRHTH